ncbi:hypothetical protein G6O69_02890 [Pseudenhygromyxa sp. WMMC2535]|uniref:hypothetical protein n=1 Tax=Pseudenhygromyxa sp. WMMC2535 TaxID=2712867 RepID=UPI00155700C9|nr:hypothetical protein [Pseudenhygromyxa sp. WMMC2535]NVB36763.1 hypothetical protein [Pseudenhygromyxa sp. WMMC2535]
MFIKIDDEGQVWAHPACLDLAAALIRQRGLTSLHVWTQGSRSEDGRVDLSLLSGVPSLRSLHIAGDISEDRILNHEAIYGLTALTKLAPGACPPLQLSSFPDLECLRIAGNRPHRGVGTLTKLRELTLYHLPDGDLSFLGGLAQLEVLGLVWTRGEVLEGLEAIANLTELEISNSSDLVRINPLPPKLRDLNIQQCPKLTEFGFLAGNTSLEVFFVMTKVDSLAFVPSMTRLERLFITGVSDRDLSPLLASESLRKISIRPFKKHYSHTKAELLSALGPDWRVDDVSLTREPEADI